MRDFAYKMSYWVAAVVKFGKRDNLPPTAIVKASGRISVGFLESSSPSPPHCFSWFLKDRRRTTRQPLRASSTVNKKNQHLKLFFATKSNFLRFSLKIKKGVSSNSEHLKL